MEDTRQVVHSGSERHNYKFLESWDSNRRLQRQAQQDWDSPVHRGFQ